MFDAFNEPLEDYENNSYDEYEEYEDPYEEEDMDDEDDYYNNYQEEDEEEYPEEDQIIDEELTEFNEPSQDEDDEDESSIPEDLDKVEEKPEEDSYDFLTEEENKLYKKRNEAAIDIIRNKKDLTDFQRSILMDDFINRNMRLIYWVANKKVQAKFMIDIKELIGAGQLGLVKALNNYDLERGNKFSTFAIKCIDNEIKYIIRNESKHYENNVSADAPIRMSKDSKETSMIDMLPDDAETPMERMQNEARREEIRERLKKLDPLEKYVTYTRYGFDLEEPMTQKQVAAAVHMSQANISKIEKTCLDKLKDIMRDL